MKKTMLHMILAILSVGGMAGCASKDAKKTAAQAPLSVSSIDIAKDGKSTDGRAVQVLEIDSSNGNKNLLIVIGKVESMDLSRPQGIKINGSVVRFNPIKVNGQVYVFFPVGGGVTMPLTGVSAAATKPKCTAATISFPELDQLLSGIIIK
jgi:hypothetical protein